MDDDGYGTCWDWVYVEVNIVVKMAAFWSPRVVVASRMARAGILGMGHL